MAVYKVLRFENGSNIPVAEVEFTEAEVDAIYSAMGDYQDYGDEEQEISSDIRTKLAELS
jgi:hypothetical protein